MPVPKKNRLVGLDIGSHSIKLAEMSLAPAVRSADADTIVCAAGTSCREQIEHTTGKSALHPIEVLAGALRGQNET